MMELSFVLPNRREDMEVDSDDSDGDLEMEDAEEDESEYDEANSEFEEEVSEEDSEYDDDDDDSLRMEVQYLNSNARVVIPNRPYKDAEEFVAELNERLSTDSFQLEERIIPISTLIEFRYCPSNKKVVLWRIPQKNHQATVINPYEMNMAIKISRDLGNMLGFRGAGRRPQELEIGRYTMGESELSNVPTPDKNKGGEGRVRGLPVLVYMNDYLESSFLHDKKEPLLYFGDYRDHQKLDRVTYLPLTPEEAIHKLTFFIRDLQGRVPHIRYPDLLPIVEVTRPKKTYMKLHFRRRQTKS